ncbi:AEC family transporter [Paenibacillus hunanensis]|uniref:AEC family transporter n=1 Tax=Paenibacillus hunanensis TaxID=539262 RepID=UPI002A6B0161|nr:AEC family transporter [Paenibacillus hunanensis]WPP43472.1 AEC family transporter [Paenibacillus hunanensis]
MSVGHIFVILIPIFFVIILGFLGGHFKVFSPASSKGLNTLVTKFALPAHLFIGITTTSKQTLIEKWPFFMTMFLGIIGFYVIMLLIMRLVFRMDLNTSSIFSLNSTQPSFAFMGIPVLGSLFGAAEVAIPIAITGIVVNALLDPIATIVSSVGKKTQASSQQDGEHQNLFKLTIHSILHGLREPLACVPLIGVVLTLLGFHAPQLLQDSLDQIGDITSGAALFAIGVTIGLNRIKLSGSAISISVLKVIGLPLLTLAFAAMLGLSSDDVTMAVLLVSFPGSAVAAMIATRFETLEVETASSFVLSSILSLISLPILISLLL